MKDGVRVVEVFNAGLDNVFAERPEVLEGRSASLCWRCRRPPVRVQPAGRFEGSRHPSAHGCRARR